MRATEVLKEEHRIIEQVLDCLEKLAANGEASGSLDRKSAGQVLDFLRTFADRCHHGKEENHLFRMLEERGFRRETGPTGVMMHEHELGRSAIEAMTAAVAGVAEGEAAACGGFVRAARAYIELMRQHIRKENGCLFPMADQLLTPEDCEALMQAFLVAESEELDEGTHDRYVRLADELADRFGVPRMRPESAPSMPCSHGHR